MIKLSKALYFLLFLLVAFALLYLLSNTRIPRTFSDVIGRSDCQLSRLESNDFFCETDTDWTRRKELFHLQHNRNRFKDTPYMFFQDNYEPTFSCRFEQRLGLNGDGGKWICDVYRLRQLNSCLIYSLGSNGEFSFEKETKLFLPNCDIHTFDMRGFNCTDICTFHQAKIGDGSGNTTTLRTIMSDLHHSERQLDVLKIDVEGSEFEVFDELFNGTDHFSEKIHQILLEVHFGPLIHVVNNITFIDYKKLHRLFQLFHDNNYVIFHKEVNLYSPYHAFEFSLVRLTKQFFQIKNKSNSTDYPR